MVGTKASGFPVLRNARALARILPICWNDSMKKRGYRLFSGIHLSSVSKGKETLIESTLAAPDDGFAG
ncbi:MAG TPA: hypothetical protein PKD58_05255 [Candidatus Sumerlaeota bacterium]|nr:hypothetical protein [Candidatus Sumerlaeota bacterium]HMZ51257.1 hypothetical protein [Candidatus Sumerlaeota bacterium]HNM47341.1 hypothetical protein [Candidatus Sumerlaeota bacterium]